MTTNLTRKEVLDNDLLINKHISIQDKPSIPCIAKFPDHHTHPNHKRAGLYYGTIQVDDNTWAIIKVNNIETNKPMVMLHDPQQICW